MNFWSFAEQSDIQPEHFSCSIIAQPKQHERFFSYQMC